MALFKPVAYSTTAAIMGKLFGKGGMPQVAAQPSVSQMRRPLRGLGATSLSMSNDMMLGMALGGVLYLVAKKKGLLGKRATA